ncbi:MAG TPA: inositol monophosphatase family protein [Longimicrobium sp.]|nr:inositol monophosphatase family protein [Longimicrobium sp.]
MTGASPFGDEAAFALAVAADAAQLVAAGSGTADVREKQRADLVTDVDVASEALIVGRLRERFPSDAVLAEESAAAAVLHGRRWVIDPVDGTANFVHGHPFVAVSIALWDDEGPAVGVVHAPFLGEVYHAVRGGGAFLNGRPIRVSRTDAFERSLLATGFPFKMGKGDLDAWMLMVADAIRSTHDVRRAGSAALDLAFTAAGRVEGFFEIGLAPWDVAAGILLVTEAGGRVTGWPGDADPPVATGRILASNGRIHKGLWSLAERWVGRVGGGGAPR